MEKTLYRTEHQFWEALDKAIKDKKEIYVWGDCSEATVDYCLEIDERDVYNFHVPWSYNIYDLQKTLMYNKHNGSYDANMAAFIEYIVDREFSADFSFVRLYIFFIEQ